MTRSIWRLTLTLLAATGTASCTVFGLLVLSEVTKPPPQTTDLTAIQADKERVDWGRKATAASRVP